MASLNITRGGWGSLADGVRLGYTIGSDMRRRREEDALKSDLSAVEQDTVISDANSGAADAMEYGRTAQNLDPENFESPEQMQAAEDAYLGSARDALVAGQGAGHSVKGRTFDNLAEAKAYAAQMRGEGLASAYRKHGKPEQALKLEAANLEMRGAQRADKLGEKSLGLEMGKVENQLATMKQDFKNQVAAGKLKGLDLQKSIFGAFADAAEKNPVFANQMLRDPDVLKGMGITDASYTPDKKGLIFTLEDGQRASATFDNLQAWRNGKGELQYKVLGEGDELVAYDGKGNAKTVASVAKKGDPSKNDAAMDDAVSVMTRFLDTNKNMMTQFGGNEQKAREEMRLAHDKGIGEFKRRSGRAPTVEEAAIIAEGSFNRAKQKYLGGK